MKNIWTGIIENIEQCSAHDSFIGGIPKLPAGTTVPVCTLCSHEMTFMFQIAFPEGHFWTGKTLALFYCLDCFGHQFCIPERPPGSSLLGVEIPEGFLDHYQRNFKTIIFNTADGVELNSYHERVAFRNIKFVSEEKNRRDAEFTLGGRPIWIMRKNETPGTYASTRKLKLLFQIKEGFRFPKRDDARPQANDFMPNKLSPFAWYDLFVGNRIYFWGTLDKDTPAVYISVQRS